MPNDIPKLRVANRRTPIRPQVYSIIREAIIAGRLKPGQALSEKDLALQFEVSRTPVREALIQLEEEGLVEIYAQVGTFVSRIRLQEVYESQFIREALECASIRKAAEKVTPQEIRELYAILEEQRRAEEIGARDAFYASDEALHRRIIAISGFPRVWKVAQSAKAHMDRVRRLSLPMPSQIAGLIQQHEQVVRGLENGDADAAERALRAHLREVFRLGDTLLEQYPDYFAEPRDQAVAEGRKRYEPE